MTDERIFGLAEQHGWLEGLMMTLQSAGAPLALGLAILAVALWGVRLPLAWGLQPLWGLEALWWSFPLSALASLLLSLAYYRWGHWRQTRLLGSAPPVP